MHRLCCTYTQCRGVVTLLGSLLLLLVAGCRFDFQQSPPSAVFTPLPLPTRTATTARTASAQATPVPAAWLTQQSTEEQLLQIVVPQRDLRGLTMRLNPDVAEVPLVVNTTTPDYNVGDEIQFWVHNLDTNRSSPITAQLVY